MNKDLNCIPIYLKENIDYCRYEEDGYMSFISKKHQEVQKLQINKQGKNILELSDGNNTINEISKEILNKYSEVTTEKIKKDVFNMLFKFWRLGIVDWKTNNPFYKMYNKEIKDISCKILTEDESISIFENNDKYFFTPLFNKNFLQDKTNIGQRVYFGFEQYNLIRKDNQEIIYGISKKNFNSNSCYINFYKISDICDIEEIKELINWTIGRYKNLIKVNFFRVDTFIPNKFYTDDEYNNLISFIKKLGFNKSGELKEHILIEDKYFNIDIYSSKL